VDVGTEIEVDESICISCGGSTYIGETISCETCLMWFHFQCVGVTHLDDCVRMEDVPYYCPACHLKSKKQKKPKKPKKDKPPIQAKASTPKTPKNKNRPKTSSASTSSSPTIVSPSSEGLKMKISFKSPVVAEVRENLLEKVPKFPLDVDTQSLLLGLSPIPIEEVEPLMALQDSGDSSPEQTTELVIDEGGDNKVRLGKVELKNSWTKLEMGSCPVKEESYHGSVDTGINTNKAEGVKRHRNASEEEEQWLEAVEAGTLHEVDEELRSVKEPRLMTARQRAMLDRADGCETPPEEDGHISLDYGFKKKNTAPSNLIEKALKAQKRKELESEKKEKMKKKTMDTLLKKKDSKATKQIKSSKLLKDFIPKIMYIINSRGSSISYPESASYELEPQVKREIPVPVFCSVAGCKNIKKYSCSKSGKPLCSLACYKINMESNQISSYS